MPKNRREKPNQMLRNSERMGETMAGTREKEGGEWPNKWVEDWVKVGRRKSRKKWETVDKKKTADEGQRTKQNIGNRTVGWRKNESEIGKKKKGRREDEQPDSVHHKSSKMRSPKWLILQQLSKKK